MYGQSKNVQVTQSWTIRQGLPSALITLFIFVTYSVRMLNTDATSNQTIQKNLKFLAFDSEVGYLYIIYSNRIVPVCAGENDNNNKCKKSGNQDGSNTRWWLFWKLKFACLTGFWVHRKQSASVHIFQYQSWCMMGQAIQLSYAPLVAMAVHFLHQKCKTRRQFQKIR